jgi:hypothetical protein
MITEKDILKVESIKKHIQKEVYVGENGVDWEKAEWMDLLDKLISNLKLAPESYKPASQEDKEKRFYTVKCSQCGWWGSSKFLNGGGPIADTGDYFECTCPVCDSYEVEEKEEI